MKISIAQINSKLGNFTYNKEKIRSCIHQAITDNANILILPFGAVSGFPQGHLMSSEDFRKKIRDTFEELALETINTDLSVFIEGQEILAKGEISSAHSLDENSTETKLSLSTLFNKKNMDIFVNLGPKVFEKNRAEAHEIELQLLAKEKKAWVFDINLAGSTDELIFTGLSCILNPNGEIITRLKFVEEDFCTIDLDDEGDSKSVNIITPIPSGEDALKKVIVEGIKNYAEKNNFAKVLVSVSGGIDSALVLALAVEALGNKNVQAIYLPSKFSSELSRECAKKICANFNVSLKEISIEKMHTLFKKELTFLENGNKIWEENIQARIRGNIVMSIANAEEYLVLTTGNKTESAVGYCTLYGDTCGGLAPISDLLKTEVRALCHFINSKYNNEMIPPSIIERTPTAELRENQQDEDTLPNYEFLDQVLFLHCEEGLDCSQITERLGRKEDIIHIFTLLYKSSYKRKQAPIGLKISKRYFGLDWHIPSTVASWFNEV